jgi:hypothetical protein
MCDVAGRLQDADHQQHAHKRLLSHRQNLPFIGIGILPIFYSDFSTK